MTDTVTILGTAALTVGKWQTAPGTVPKVLEHEVLARLVMQAVADAGVDKSDIGSMIFALPRPYTQQKYFATFMANYLRLPCAGTVAEMMGDGMTAPLAFQAAVDEIRLGKTKVALALGINFETATSSAEHRSPGTPWMPPVTSMNSTHHAKNSRQSPSASFLRPRK